MKPKRQKRLSRVHELVDMWTRIHAPAMVGRVETLEHRRILYTGQPLATHVLAHQHPRTSCNFCGNRFPVPPFWTRKIAIRLPDVGQAYPEERIERLCCLDMAGCLDRMQASQFRNAVANDL